MVDLPASPSHDANYVKGWDILLIDIVIVLTTNSIVHHLFIHNEVII